MTAFDSKYSLRPRGSQETDRRYLLAPSIAPSEPASVTDHTTSGETTPRAQTATQTHQTRRTTEPAVSTSYRGFPSEAHYLAALQQWADEKKYVNLGQGLVGFYGDTTLNELASRPKLEVGFMKKLKERMKSKKEARRV